MIGFIAGLVYSPVSYVLLHRLSIDDPVDAFTVHGVSGGRLASFRKLSRVAAQRISSLALGVFLTGIFSMNGGLLYSGSVDLLVVQLIGIAVLAGWSIGKFRLQFILLH